MFLMTENDRALDVSQSGRQTMIFEALDFRLKFCLFSGTFPRLKLVLRCMVDSRHKIALSAD